MDEKNRQRLLDKILLRKALLKEYEKATSALVAQLQQDMEEHGTVELVGTNGGLARINSTSSVKLSDSIEELMTKFDARTMAALLTDVKVNAAKQGFLARVANGRDFSSIMRVSRSNQFSVLLPRTKEQAGYMRTAIQADLEEMEKKTNALLEAYDANENTAVLPDDPSVDAMLSPPKKSKKAAKKKTAKKKVAKKKK